MLVVVQSDTRIHTQTLPISIAGTHDIVAIDGRVLATAEGSSAAWVLRPSTGLRMGGADGDVRPMATLDPNASSAVVLSDKDGTIWRLVFCPDDMASKTSKTFGFMGTYEMVIGRTSNATICYDNPFVSSHNVCLRYDGAQWTALDEGSTNGTFVNSIRLPIRQETQLSFGDVVTVLGLNLVVGRQLFSLNNPGGEVSVQTEGLVAYRARSLAVREDAAKRDNEFFYPGLRFVRTVQEPEFKIDAPPAPEKPEEQSLAMRVGPSLVMGLASVLSAATFVAMMADSGSSMLRVVPMVAMAVSMLAGSVLWPVLSGRSREKTRKRKEALRRSAYSQYLSVKRSEMIEAMGEQREILLSKRVSMGACMQRAASVSDKLMDRTPLHDDYLHVRVGVGELPFQAKVTFPDVHFTLEEDDLREAVDAFAAEPRVLSDVPLAHSLVDKNVLGVVGEEPFVSEFVSGIVAQLATFCSYENVKIVLLCEKENRSTWEFASHLPHTFSDDKQVRYFACGLSEADEIGMGIERILETRREENGFEARNAKPYFVVVCASERIADRAAIVDAIAENPNNLGVSLVSIARRMRDLPKACASVIEVEREKAFIIDRDDPTTARKEFRPDIFLSRLDAEAFAANIGRVRLDLAVESQKLPARLGFLEMLEAGSVRQFNFAETWRQNNASTTLACTVGRDVAGEPFVLNLHEKAHGPHGLIAGTTGSGKSEFIITWILSLAMSYSPNDVAFVLIDYKGGGLAKAFDNERVRLPHLAGVITNLDGRAINRSLVSIQSELKRRQALFNRARDVAGGENVDIYKYLDLFRQGKMREPCPHLFIVADEFAELKDQQPDFMDELISAARIGRSLGVHLVLATQKPSGVVNAQIWSNSRFKVCLKVADAADSREMISRPDAAELVQAGRFYLLVGYNEYFALGQSGYSGTTYVEREVAQAERDDTVVMISDTGSPLVSVSPQQKGKKKGGQPEAVVVLDAIQHAAQRLGVKARQLWLNPIPDMITVDATVKKYVASEALADEYGIHDLNPLVGEYDDPERQRQDALTLPLSRGGNALVYGTADSGVEAVLMSMMYSLLTRHTAQTLNVYALDFGSESLRAWEQAPQVGGIACAGDDEKVQRLLSYIEGEIACRRAKLSSSGGSFERYVQNHNDLPAILLVVNDVGTFLEAYPKLEDRIVSLTNNLGRGGIHLVMTAANMSSLRMRMRSGFRQTLAVNLPDADDYGVIFGIMRGVPEPKGFARGLVALDDGLFEFQGCHISDDGDDYGAAESLAARCAAEAQTEGLSNAVPVPMAPDVVRPNDLLGVALPPLFVPYGISDITLTLAGLDFSESPLMRFVYQRKKEGAAFGKAFLQVATALPAWDVALFDMAGTFGENRPQDCRFSTREADSACSFLESVMAGAVSIGEDKRLLLVFTGLATFATQGDMAFTGKFKVFLKGLRTEGDVAVVMLDSSTDTSYTYEDWFKTHLTNKDGVWIGPGVDSQNCIQTAYNNKFASDSAMRSAKGYAIDGGMAELVHLVSIPKDETQTDISAEKEA